MRFSSFQIKGKGRGKGIGFPTINLDIPTHFEMKDGVYAVIVGIEGRSYSGALHYGPIPVFNETEKSLEIFLLDVVEANFPVIKNKTIEVDVKRYIREIISFSNPKALAAQIQQDVEDIRNVLRYVSSD